MMTLNDTELLRFLTHAAVPHSGRLAIIAGHFMLMLDERQDRLVPMVWQDATSPDVSRLSRCYAGDFPVRTFKLGVKLLQSCARRESVSARVLILVNDHKFQSPSFRCNVRTPIRGRPGELRRGFYRGRRPLPRAFMKTLAARGLRPSDVVMRHDNPRRSRTDILPKRSVFYSETALRNCFDKYTKPSLLRDSHFSQRIVRSGSRSCSRLLFTPVDGEREIDMTENGKCGCSGEVLQLILEVSEKQITDVVFFVPGECGEPVALGVQAALYVSEQRFGRSPVVHTVTSVNGSKPGNGKAPSTFQVATHARRVRR